MNSHPSKPMHSRHDTALIHGLSGTEVQTLSETSSEAKSKAYCPYSKFQVGASILLKSGAIIQGANVENASYPVGTCAERVALGYAVFQGIRMGDVKALAVATNLETPGSPCGMCRQFIREFCEPTMPILMFDINGKYVSMTVEQVLPMSFGPEKLLPPGDIPSHA
ncbi:hypothetical protein MBLNU457_g0649t1 [Dothideomycetes sp. NU457]